MKSFSNFLNEGVSTSVVDSLKGHGWDFVSTSKDNARGFIIHMLEKDGMIAHVIEVHDIKSPAKFKLKPKLYVSGKDSMKNVMPVNNDAGHFGSTPSASSMESHIAKNQ